MITLITGANGHGKGVYCIDVVQKKALAENRQVYYNGIPDCKVNGWIELTDPRDWMSLPPNSIFIQDEAQEIYKPMSPSVEPPPFILKLGRHRQEFGLDMFFMTPHPMNLHAMLRRGVGEHYHLVRKWGAEKANVHFFPAVRDNVDKNRKDSVVTTYKYNKDVYGLYTSAPAHTMKAKMPLRLVLAYLSPIPVALLCWYSYHLYQKSQHVNELAVPQTNSQTLVANNNGQKPFDWIAAQIPRIADLPQSASKYDEITKPTLAPMPVACISSRLKCKCYTQQGTKYDTSENTCKSIVKNGYFQDFDPNGNQQKLASNQPHYQGSSMGGIGGGVAPPMAANDSQNSIVVNSRSIP